MDVDKFHSVLAYIWNKSPIYMGNVMMSNNMLSIRILIPYLVNKLVQDNNEWHNVMKNA